MEAARTALEVAVEKVTILTSKKHTSITTQEETAIQHQQQQQQQQQQLHAQQQHANTNFCICYIYMTLKTTGGATPVFAGSRDQDALDTTGARAGCGRCPMMPCDAVSEVLRLHAMSHDVESVGESGLGLLWSGVAA